MVNCAGMNIEVLQIDDNTVYLGSAINLKSMSETEVDNRINRAWVNLSSLRKSSMTTPCC